MCRREVEQSDHAAVVRLAHERHDAILGVVLDLDHASAALARLQRLFAVFERDEASVKLGVAVGTVVDYRVAVEKGERTVEA